MQSAKNRIGSEGKDFILCQLRLILRNHKI